MTAPATTPCLDWPTLWARAQAWVGRAYEPGVFDCAHLAVAVQQDLFGRTVTLPQLAQHPGGRRGQAAEILRWRAVVARPAGAPATGQAVLLESGGTAGGVLHIGTLLVDPDGVRWLLHNSAHLGSAALQRLADVERFGAQVLGFYEWRGVAA